MKRPRGKTELVMMGSWPQNLAYQLCSGDDGVAYLLMYFIYSILVRLSVCLPV